MPTPDPQQVVQAWSVHSAAEVQQAWKASPAAHLQLVLCDDRYHALPASVWLALAQATHTDQLKYVRSFFDCNSIADALKGLVKARWAVNGIGLVVDTSGKHAFNAVLVAGDAAAGLTLAFVEPQRDAFVQPQSKPCYDLKQGFAIF